MRPAIKEKLAFPREGSDAAESPIHGGEAPLRLHTPVEVPIALVEWQLPAKIPEERFDYYEWVFHQRGFSSVQITLAQFLAVVAAVHQACAQDMTRLT